MMNINFSSTSSSVSQTELENAFYNLAYQHV